MGNITTKATEHGNYGYGYDTNSRLISADNPVLANEGYAYDHVGNRPPASNADGSIAHNLNNELEMYGEMTYEYDDNGNMTRKSVGTVAVNYVYNAENRLIRVEDELTQTVIAEYGYDPFGRRLWKEVSGVRTYFFYSEEGLIAEYDETGIELRSYGYKPDSTWTTDPLWLKQGGAYYWYQNDHMGTPQKLTNSSGSVVWSAQYAAFGETVIDVETITNNLRFPGQYYDAETGLHYNYQRYYEPGSGRYVSIDPIGLEGGINVFRYTRNNPAKRSDPLGLWVHPQHIVTPKEAYQIVAQTAALISVNTGNPQTSYDEIAEMHAEEQIKLLMKHIRKDDALRELYGIDDGKEFSEAEKLLALLAGFVVRPGVADPGGWHNRFIFTCQFGWIDMGHFFIAAGVWGYSSSLKATIANTILLPSEMGELGELGQWTKAQLKGQGRGNPNFESAFTPEDFLSNELGIRFGRLVKQLEPVRAETVVAMWDDFLVDSGAVAYETVGENSFIYDLLQRDVLDWWEEYKQEYLLTKREDPHATFKHEYRDRWEKLRCKSRAYRDLCCCAISEHDCQNNLSTGGCWAKPKLMTPSLCYTGQ